MAIKFLNGEKDIEKEIKEGVVVLNFFSQTCGPCKMLGPILEELSQEVKVIKVDIDIHENKELILKRKIQGIPHTFFYKDGKLKKEHLGFVPLETMKQTLNNL